MRTQRLRVVNQSETAQQRSDNDKIQPQACVTPQLTPRLIPQSLQKSMFLLSQRSRQHLKKGGGLGSMCRQIDRINNLGSAKAALGKQVKAKNARCTYEHPPS